MVLLTFSRPLKTIARLELLGRFRRLLPTLVAATTLMVGPVNIQAAILLASDATGLMHLSNVDDYRANLASLPFRLTLGGVEFEASGMAGATRLEDGRIVAAIRPASAASNNVQEGWALYEIHPAARTLTKLTPLEAALSAIAVGPSGKLFGITFRPASLVVIDTDDGHFVDLETFWESQDDVSPVFASLAGLAFDEERNEFLYLHKNHSGRELAFWMLAADGSSAEPLDHGFLGSAQPSDLAVSDGRILAPLGSTIYRTQRNPGSVDLSFQARLVNFSFLGSVSHVPKGFLVDVTKDLSCIPSSETLCLQEGAYEITLDWTDPNFGATLPGEMVIQSTDSGSIWFVEPSNLEVLVKVLDGCGVNAHRWVFASASTDLEFHLRVRETATGKTQIYSSPPSTAADAVTDVTAFPCF